MEKYLPYQLQTEHSKLVSVHIWKVRYQKWNAVVEKRGCCLNDILEWNKKGQAPFFKEKKKRDLMHQRKETQCRWEELVLLICKRFDSFLKMAFLFPFAIWVVLYGIILAISRVRETSGYFPWRYFQLECFCNCLSLWAELCAPPNSHLEALPSRTTECGFIWR